MIDHGICVPLSTPSVLCDIYFLCDISFYVCGLMLGILRTWLLLLVHRSGFLEPRYLGLAPLYSGSTIDQDIRALVSILSTVAVFYILLSVWRFFLHPFLDAQDFGPRLSLLLHRYPISLYTILHCTIAPHVDVGRI
jgi:hypothetical protein